MQKNKGERFIWFGKKGNSMFVIAVRRSVNRDYDTLSLFLPQSARLNGDQFNTVCRFCTQEMSPEGGQNFYHANERQGYTHQGYFSRIDEGRGTLKLLVCDSCNSFRETVYLEQ